MARRLNTLKRSILNAGYEPGDPYSLLNSDKDLDWFVQKLAELDDLELTTRQKEWRNQFENDIEEVQELEQPYVPANERPFWDQVQELDNLGWHWQEDRRDLRNAIDIIGPRGYYDILTVMKDVIDEETENHHLLKEIRDKLIEDWLDEATLPEKFSFEIDNNEDHPFRAFEQINDSYDLAERPVYEAQDLIRMTRGDRGGGALFLRQLYDFLRSYEENNFLGLNPREERLAKTVLENFDLIIPSLPQGQKRLFGPYKSHTQTLSFNSALDILGHEFFQSPILAERRLHEIASERHGRFILDQLHKAIVMQANEHPRDRLAKMLLDIFSHFNRITGKGFESFRRGKIGRIF